MDTTYSFADWQSGRAPPKGWDGADMVADGWTRDQIEAWMKATVGPWAPADAGEPADAGDPPPAPTAPPPPPPPPPAPAAPEMRHQSQVKPDDEPAGGRNVVDMRTRLHIVQDVDWRARLKFSDGKLRPSVQLNWALHLENHPDMVGVIAFDAFKRRTMIMREPPWHHGVEFKARQISDTDYAEAAMWLEDQFMSPTPSKIQPIFQAIAERNSFDPLEEFLSGIKWDGKKRIDTWLTYYLGVSDTAYSRAVGRKMLIASVARALSPGCKADTMPILEGDQGLGKSGALRALYGSQFFTDEISDVATKDASQEMQGVWCIEMAEMQRISSADANAVKKFLSRQVDRYRPPYGRNVIDAPRRAVFAGTINPDGNPYLRDVTGARRFWPVKVEAIDLDAIEKDREQLWAEAVAAFRAGDAWWMREDDERHARAEQSARTDLDVWSDIIGGIVFARASITRLELFEALGISNRDADGRHSFRIGRIMSTLGWVQERDERGVKFRKPGAAPTMADF